MNRKLRNFSLLLLPFLIMLAINELVRPSIQEEPYSRRGIIAMNSVEDRPDKCTWICHQSTRICKEKHVKFLQPFFKHTDPLYFGIINLLQGTGNYGLANIIFLVILVPFLIWWFLTRSLNIQDEINRIKRNPWRT